MKMKVESLSVKLLALLATNWDEQFPKDLELCWFIEYVDEIDVLLKKLTQLESYLYYRHGGSFGKEDVREPLDHDAALKESILYLERVEKLKRHKQL